MIEVEIIGEEKRCDDCISRQAAIDKFEPWLKVDGYSEGELNMLKAILYELKFLPSAQPERTEMIKEIRKWINSTNRGNADYFIVDKIEEIINRYE